MFNSEGRASEDVEHRGTLQITDATPTDSDTYKCTVSYINPDDDKNITETFVHSLYGIIIISILLTYTRRILVPVYIIGLSGVKHVL